MTKLQLNKADCYGEISNSYFKFQQFYKHGFSLKTKLFMLKYGTDSFGKHFSLRFSKLSVSYRFGDKDKFNTFN